MRRSTGAPPRRTTLSTALHDPESTGDLDALIPKNLRAETKEPKEKRVVRKSHPVTVEMGDSFSPLNDHSRLSKRNDYIRYFGDRKKQVFMRQFIWAVYELLTGDATKYQDIDMNTFKDEFEALRLEELTPRDTKYAVFLSKWFDGEGGASKIPKNIVDDAYDMVKYRPITGLKYVVRVLWILSSLGGNVNKAWATMTSSSYIVAGSLLTSYLVQSQTEVNNLVNGQEVWMDAEKFVHNAVQMGVLVVGMLTAVQMINYFGYCWKSQGRIIREARFKYSLDRYTDQDPTMSDWSLDYNTDCDPDTSTMFFTLREEQCDKKGAKAFDRLIQLLWLPVDDTLLRGVLDDEIKRAKKIN